MTSPELVAGRHRKCESLRSASMSDLRGVKWRIAFGRYYDPATEQFLSVDPLADETATPYAFTAGDPVNLTDPNGMSSWSQSLQAFCNEPAENVLAGAYTPRFGERLEPPIVALGVSQQVAKAISALIFNLHSYFGAGPPTVPDELKLPRASEISRPAPPPQDAPATGPPRGDDSEPSSNPYLEMQEQMDQEGMGQAWGEAQALDDTPEGDL